MKQGGSQTAGGFTIVETLIVLAITGALVISAITLISGKQNATEFQVGVTNLQQQIQQLVNQTQNGYYPNNGNIKCSSGVGGGNPRLAIGSTPQGQNVGCVFIGTALRFGSGAGHTDDYTMIPLVGNRLDVSGKEAQTLLTARPTAIAPTSSDATIPNATTAVKISNGLTFQWLKLGSVSPAPTSVIAFITTFGAYSSNGLLSSGSQQLNLWTLPNTPTTPLSTTDIVDRIDTGAANFQQVNDPSNVRLCFDSGTTKQAAIITITAGLQLSTQVEDGQCAGLS